MCSDSLCITSRPVRTPWNKGKLIGQKPPLKPKEICALRVRRQLAHNVHDLALFNLAIDSTLRACDLVRLRVRDVFQGGHVLSRVTVRQQKTGLPVQFELTGQTREAVQAWISTKALGLEQPWFPRRPHDSPHLSTRQYARIVKGGSARSG
jgi:integrase